MGQENQALVGIGIDVTDEAKRIWIGLGRFRSLEEDSVIAAQARGLVDVVVSPLAEVETAFGTNHKIELRLHGPRAVLRVAQTFPIGELRQDHAMKLIEAGKLTHPVLGLIATDAPVELVPGQDVHQLGEHRLSVCISHSFPHESEESMDEISQQVESKRSFLLVNCRK